jgi:hypothetical protein
MGIKIYGQETLENGSICYRIEVSGTSDGRFYDTNSIYTEQLRLFVTPLGVISNNLDTPFVPILNGGNGYPVKHTWEQVLSYVQDPTTPIFGGAAYCKPSSRWKGDDETHTEIVWETSGSTSLRKPGKWQRVYITKTWYTSPYDEGDLDIGYDLLGDRFPKFEFSDDAPHENSPEYRDYYETLDRNQVVGCQFDISGDKTLARKVFFAAIQCLKPGCSELTNLAQIYPEWADKSLEVHLHYAWRPEGHSEKYQWWYRPELFQALVAA